MHNELMEFEKLVSEAINGRAKPRRRWPAISAAVLVAATLIGTALHGAVLADKLDTLITLKKERQQQTIRIMPTVHKI